MACHMHLKRLSSDCIRRQKHSRHKKNQRTMRNRRARPTPTSMYSHRVRQRARRSPSTTMTHSFDIQAIPWMWCCLTAVIPKNCTTATASPNNSKQQQGKQGRACCHAGGLRRLESLERRTAFRFVLLFLGNCRKEGHEEAKQMQVQKEAKLRE